MIQTLPQSVNVRTMITKGMMSSNAQDWETPDGFFAELDAEFHFDTDVCAEDHNAKCPVYFTPKMDGLAQSWSGGKTYWMNPPYGRQIGKWIQKAYESPATVVCLVPARTDTAWWHNYCMKGEIRFIRGRLYFKRNGARSAAPFPSAVVIFRAKGGGGD